MRTVFLLVAALASVGCGDPPVAPDAGDDAALGDASSAPACRGDALDGDAMHAHLEAFADIAAANGGDRAAGGPGYDASVDYVAEALRGMGLEPTLDPFDLALFRELRPTRLTLTDAEGELEVLEAPEVAVTFGSGSGTLEGAVVPVGADEACSACSLDAWEAFPGGAVAWARGEPSDAATLAAFARIAGASALLIAVSDEHPERPWQVVTTAGGAPVLLVGSDASARARAAQRARVEVEIDPRAVVASTNVLAELPGERDDGVVVLGAHLDSVIDAAGVNDNGTGVAALLALTEALRACALRHPVRVAFWGGEEWGLRGSRHWVESASEVELAAMAAYLNLDMIGSPNGGLFVLGASTPGALGARLLEDYEAHGHAAVFDTRLGDRSDHAPFREAGVPIAGIFAGAEARATEEDAARFGSVVGEPYDPCYHRPCDGRGHPDEARMRAAAEGIGRLAAALAAR